MKTLPRTYVALFAGVALASVALLVFGQTPTPTPTPQDRPIQIRIKKTMMCTGKPADIYDLLKGGGAATYKIKWTPQSEWPFPTGTLPDPCLTESATPSPSPAPTEPFIVNPNMTQNLTFRSTDELRTFLTTAGL